MQAYKIMHGLWGIGRFMFTKYIVVMDDDVDVHNRLVGTASAPTPTRNATASSYANTRSW
jgi:3-polyprenyl-4-hydroxybenzoate decarboxylase